MLNYYFNQTTFFIVVQVIFEFVKSVESYYSIPIPFFFFENMLALSNFFSILLKK
jgi:hypothetical protein